MLIAFKNLDKRLSTETFSCPPPYQSKVKSKIEVGFPPLKEPMQPTNPISHPPIKPIKQGNLKFSLFRSRSKSNPRSNQKSNKSFSSKPSHSFDLVPKPSSIDSKGSPNSFQIYEATLRSQCNTATIKRRRFSSSQYDEYLKSHLTKEESPTNDIKVLDLIVDLLLICIKENYFEFSNEE